jgi:26S proteasome regulatory subunit N4
MGPSESSPAERARALIAAKEAIDLKLSTHVSVLKANNVTEHTPLVDREGFPRDDIDVWAVRQARVRIIELRNDLDKVLGEIGRALEGVYDPSLGAASSGDAGDVEGTPFAKVGGVAAASPASEAVRLRSTISSSSLPT